MTSQAGSGEITVTEASARRRVVAFLLDVAVLILPITLVIWAFYAEEIGSAAETGVARIDPLALKAWVTGLAVGLLLFAYFGGLEMSGWRGSIGKKVLALQVRSEDLAPARSGQAAGRNLVRALWAVPLVGLFVFLIDAALLLSRRRRIGDLVVRTRVAHLRGYWVLPADDDSV